jgi:class 3 adenylate cyclase/tetratricopeptide (TPR) repeat protein
MSSGGLITIVFTDLVGSTALAQELGDDAADDIRRQHFDSLRQAVASTGGTEVKNIGDALMVSYSSAADAIDGAVAMQQSVDRHNRFGDGPRLEMRVGMSAGDASFEDGDWFGAPVVEAARLVDAAAGGQILTTDIVRILAGSRTQHELRPFGDVEAKGLPQPIPASEVVWEPQDDTQMDSDLRVPLPPAVNQADTFEFVGREFEFEQLVTAWKEALAGERRAVFLAGEPGIGKTRLVKETCRLAHEQGAVVLWGGSEDELGIPFQPFSEAIRELVHSGPPDAIRDLMGPLSGELARFAPDLPNLVPDLPERISGDPETERYRLFEAVGDLFANVAARAPVVLVLDDLHWAGKPTLLLLRHLLRGTEQRPWLLIVTYRDTDLDRTHPLSEMLADLRRQAGVTRVSLSGLDARGVASFMERVAGHDLDEAGEALAAMLHTETEGNPFFVGEVLLHLVESGALIFRDGRWTSDFALGDVGIPEGVREVVGRRLSYLDATTNEVLAAAAVIGREFEISVLATLVEGGHEAVLDALDAAESSGLVAPSTSGPGTYRFAHALVRTTLSEELPTSRRLRLHRDVARALAARSDADERLSELARHFAEAAALGEVDNAVSWGRRAGAAAVVELAWEEAVTHYERAFDALTLADEVDPAVRGDLLLDLGKALRAMEDPRADDTLRKAIELARSEGDAERLTDALVELCADRFLRVGSLDETRLALIEEALDGISADDDGRRARLLSSQAGELLWTPEHERRRELSDRALAIARGFGDPEVLGDVLGQRGYVFDSMNLDSLDTFLANYNEVIELAEQLGDTALLCRSCVSRAPALIMSGERAAGEADLRRAEALANELRQPALVSRALTLRIASTLLSGRLADADVMLDAAKKYDSLHNISSNQTPSLAFRLHYERGTLGELEELFVALADAFPALPVYRTALASVYSTTDRNDEARVHLQALAADGWAIVPRDGLWIVTVAGAARMAGVIGELEIAASAYELAKGHTDWLSFTAASYEQPIALSVGTAAAAIGRFDEAEALFQKAIDLSIRCEAPTFVAGTKAQWAESILQRGDTGDTEKARTLATAALETAEKLGLGRVEILSRRVLDRL